MMKSKLIMVRWVDSAFAQGLMSKDAVGQHTVSDCISVGLMVIDNKEHITLVQSSSATTSQYGDGITIPKCCIKRIYQLRVK